MTDLLEKLKADFPKEAYSIDNSRGFNLTSLKAQYIKERLLEVFGVFGWKFEEKFVVTDTGILCHGILIVEDGDKSREVQATGFSAFKKNLGDSYKGASTDSLSKACSFIGIGNEVFKGNVNLSTKNDNNSPKFGLCKECGANLNYSEKKGVLYCSDFKNCKSRPIKHDGSTKQFTKPKIDSDIPDFGVNK